MIGVKEKRVFIVTVLNHARCILLNFVLVSRINYLGSINDKRSLSNIKAPKIIQAVRATKLN